MKTRYRAATIPIFPRTKMGNDFSIYTYYSYSSYSFHTITISAGFPAPSYFLYSLPSHISLAVFYSAFPRRSRFRFCLPRHSRFSLCPRALDCLLLSPCFSLFVSSGRAVWRTVSFRSVFRLVHVGLWGGAPFLSARFLVGAEGVIVRFPWEAAFSSRPSSRWGVWFCGRFVCRLVVRSGFSCVSFLVSFVRLVGRLVVSIVRLSSLVG